MISQRNLDSSLQSRLFPDLGQSFYIVDSDFRTVAQGWSKADRTGPLDLFAARQSQGGAQYVYRTGDYGSDAAAIQAAIDAAVDYRNDKLIFTPGNPSIATALAVDVDGLRILGIPSGHPRRSSVTLTDAVGGGLTLTASNVEIGNMTLVPKTAQKSIVVTSGDFGYVHDVYWNALGVATSTSTMGISAAASTDWLVERCIFNVDAAQGPAFDLTSSVRWTVQDCDFYVNLTTVAWASVVTFTTSALGNIFRGCTFRGCGGATAAVFTKIFTGVANVNGQLLVTDCRIDGTALSTGTDIETTFGTTTDIELIENYKSGDATTEGGTLIVLA